MTRFALPLVLLLAGASSALAQDVRYNFDKAANFGAFKTYKWVALKGATQLSDLADRQVKSAVDAELAAKGLTKSESETADLYIGYQAGVGQEKEYTSFDSGWGYGPGWYGGGWYGGGGGMGTSTTTVSTFTEGTLVVDMFDVSSKKLLWRGIATATVSDKPEKNAKKIQKAAEKMFKNFPPTAK